MGKEDLTLIKLKEDHINISTQRIVIFLMQQKMKEFNQQIELIAIKNQQLLNLPLPMFLFNTKWYPYRSACKHNLLTQNRQLHISLYPKMQAIQEKIDKFHAESVVLIQDYIQTVLHKANSLKDLQALLPVVIINIIPHVNNYYSDKTNLDQKELDNILEMYSIHRSLLTNLLCTNLITQ